MPPRLSGLSDERGGVQIGAAASINFAVTLGQLDRFEEEIGVYDDVVARYGNATEPALREQVAKALVNKAVTLGQLGRSEEEIGVYDDVVARYGNATEPALREQVELARGAGDQRRTGS